VSVAGAGFGRLMIFLAVFFQPVGKVMFGTWLTVVSSHFFVFVSFTLTAVFLLLLSRRSVGQKA
jgi:hypothetical protein